MDSAFRRSDIEFDSAGTVCRGWLYVPDGPPRPVIVMAHGAGGIKEARLDAFADRFAAAGYACLVFDYRFFGASEGSPRRLLDIRRQREDWGAALRFARGLPEVDGALPILWGTSLSGGHVITVAAQHPEVAAVIAQCPFTEGVAVLRATNAVTAAKLTALALADVASAVVRRGPVRVKVAGPARSAALMTSPDAAPGYAALQPDPSAPLDSVPARFGLQSLVDAPGRRARDVACPILFAVCEADRVTPARATLRYAATAPRGEIRTYPIGHFDIYVGEPFERAVADQIDFLHRHVPAG